MAENERLVVTVPDEVASAVEGAIAAGDYASPQDVVRDALHAWTETRRTDAERIAALKADINRALADVAAGHVAPFDSARIIERGRQLSTRR